VLAATLVPQYCAWLHPPNTSRLPCAQILRQAQAQPHTPTARKPYLMTSFGLASIVTFNSRTQDQPHQAFTRTATLRKALESVPAHSPFTQLRGPYAALVKGPLIKHHPKPFGVGPSHSHPAWPASQKQSASQKHAASLVRGSQSRPVASRKRAAPMERTKHAVPQKHGSALKRRSRSRTVNSLGLTFSVANTTTLEGLARTRHGPQFKNGTAGHALKAPKENG